MSEPSNLYISRLQAEEDERYISRLQAEAVERDFAEALQQPDSAPVVFHLWGIGGVGKTTLIKRLKKQHKPQADFAEISFQNFNQTPIELMAKLYEQLPKLPNPLQRDLSAVFKADPFSSLHEKYKQTLDQLETQPLPGRNAVDSDQKNAVQLLKNAATFWLPILTQGIVDRAMAGAVAETVGQAATTVLSVRDLLVQHSATQKDKELRDLMLEPLPKLTQAFMEGLRQRAAKCPVVLVLDTYEKAPSTVDSWLCGLLLPTPGLRSQPIRWVIAGRNHLTDQKEIWRKLQQDHQLLNGASGQRLERFDKAQTRDYLQRVGLVEPSQIEALYQKTRGLPYYLNRIRETHLKGQTIDLTQDIRQLFFPNLNVSQTQMLQLVACCRWFDQPLVRHLAEEQGLSFQSDANGDADWFEWLKQLDFLDPALKPYGLDDVARSTLRELMCNDDREAFYQTHEGLAAYFEGRANQVVAADQSEPEKYHDGDWRNYTIEAIYHMLFSRRKDCQSQFLSHLFAACYLNQMRVVVEPVQAIASETSLQQQQLLPNQAQRFLNSLELVVLEGGWYVLDTTPDRYEVNAEKTGFDKTQVEAALQACLNQIDALKGLAKFAALFYKAKRCPERQRVEWLLKAKEQAEQIAPNFNPEFSSGLFLWDIGNALSDLGRKEEAIASYDQAVAIKPDKHEAWYNRGVALSALGRNEEAIASYDEVLALKPDYYRAWDNRGDVLVNLKRYEEAIASYDLAIAINPEYRFPWKSRAVVLTRLGQFEAAHENFDQALMLQPDFANAYYNKACCYGLQQNIELAIETLQQAIALNAENRELAKTDSDFDGIRDDERFQAVIGESVEGEK